MGIYLNPGKRAFEMAANSEIFVDKTEMIQYLNSVVNTNQRYLSVSRPRRFGKTMAADMICAYYDRTADSRSMFERTKLSAANAPENDKRSEKDRNKFSWDQYLGAFDVIRIVMTDFLGDSDSVKEMISYLTDEVTHELMEAYPEIYYGKRINLRTVMNKIFAKTGRSFVVVIDEWDALFRVHREDKDGQTEYLNFLRDWLKDKSYISLAYITGILPIKKYGEHSALNMFDEYSMTEPMQFARYTGFTEEEVADLCREYGRDFGRIKEWYDGYLLRDIIPPDPRPAQDGKGLSPSRPQAHQYSIYSPLSVVKALRNGIISNYWNHTETYEALAEYIRMDFFGLQETVGLLMNGEKIAIDTSGYQNDMTTFHNRDDILTLLIHLGYLGYDSSSREVFIPNREIHDVFRTSTKTEEWANTFRSLANSEKLLEATWAMDDTKVAELVEAAHDRTSNKTYNDENALSYAIQLAYFAAEKYYTKALELDTGKGYADIVYLPSPRYPNKPALLIELKYEKGTDTALEQIHRQNYPDRLVHYKGNILLVSINYDKDRSSKQPGFKHHSCKIEKA